MTVGPIRGLSGLGRITGIRGSLNPIAWAPEPDEPDRPANRSSSYSYSTQFADYGALPGCTMNGALTKTFVAGRLYWCPFYVSRPILVWGYNYEIVTGGASASVCRRGIYRARAGDGMPDGLVVDFGATSASAAVIAAVTLPTPLTLDPGTYHAACHSADTTAAFLGFQVQTHPQVSRDGLTTMMINDPYTTLSGTADLPHVAPPVDQPARSSSSATGAYFGLNYRELA